MSSPISPPSAPPTPRRDGEATRQRLLRAALELYTSIGFRGTTTPMIAERAGVAEGTIYRHFNGKEHLLNEIFRGAQRWAVKLIKETEADRSLAARDRLHRIARHLVESGERDPAAMRMLFYSREDTHLDERSREASREMRETLQQVVAAGKSDGRIRSGPAELWSAVWLALVQFAVERACAREWPADHPHVGMTLDAAWDAITVRSE